MRKVVVDKNACIRCGYCYGSFDKVFTADEDGASTVKDEKISPDDERVIEAMEGCPTGAIKVEDVSETSEE